MDVIKTSLIIGIGLTFYYLLLQWPTDNYINDGSSQEPEEIRAFSDSERSLSEPLAPLSQPNQRLGEVAPQKLNYFEIQNERPFLESELNHILSHGTATNRIIDEYNKSGQSLKSFIKEKYLDSYKS